ncbi:MAG: PadR family transcriptional regulator [Clostridiales bacterium]|jgi:DNA-binding PadR family transcriptional regulator|nr:PadR family transcriptional regulator [Clostridiales bacterium]
MDKTEVISGCLLEMRRGTVVLCVLAKLRRPAYGYNLVSDLTDSGIAIEANTLYPLLRRMEGQRLLESAWNTDTAKPRKYYRTTEFGREVLLELKAHWHDAVQSINNILEDEIS